jgi:hypothetical protein
MTNEDMQTGSDYSTAEKNNIGGKSCHKKGGQGELTVLRSIHTPKSHWVLNIGSVLCWYNQGKTEFTFYVRRAQLISGANRVFTNPQKHFPTAQHKSDLKKGRVGTGYIPNTSSQTVSMRYMFEEGEEFITGRVSEHIVRYITYFFFPLPFLPMVLITPCSLIHRFDLVPLILFVSFSPGPCFKTACESKCEKLMRGSCLMNHFAVPHQLPCFVAHFNFALIYCEHKNFVQLKSYTCFNCTWRLNSRADSTLSITTHNKHRRVQCKKKGVPSYGIYLYIPLDNPGVIWKTRDFWFFCRLCKKNEET